MKSKIANRIVTLTRKYGYFDSSIASKHFRNYNSNGSIDSVVMRTARRLKAYGVLNSRNTGKFTLTSRWK